MLQLQKFETDKSQYVIKIDFLKEWGFCDYEMGVGATLAFVAVVSKRYLCIETFYPDKKITVNNLIKGLEKLVNQSNYVFLLEEDTAAIWQRHDLAVSKDENWLRNDPDSSHEYLITKLESKNVHSYQKLLPYLNDEETAEDAMSRYYLLDTQKQWIFSLRKHPSGFEIYQQCTA